MSDKIGDYKWHQISQFDLPPAYSVTKFVPIGKTGMNAHYMLIRINNVIENGYSFDIVKTAEGVPWEVLFDMDSGYYTSVNHAVFYCQLQLKETLDDEPEAMK